MVAAMPVRAEMANRSGAVGEAQAKNLRVEKATDRPMSGVKREGCATTVGPYESCLAAKRSCTKRIRDGRLGDDALPSGGTYQRGGPRQGGRRITEP